MLLIDETLTGDISLMSIGTPKLIIKSCVDVIIAVVISAGCPGIDAFFEKRNIYGL